MHKELAREQRKLCFYGLYLTDLRVLGSFQFQTRFPLLYPSTIAGGQKSIVEQPCNFTMDCDKCGRYFQSFSRTQPETCQFL